jgi:uncharacterized protein (TIGR01777 family)
MKIIVTGSTGLIGTALVRSFLARGDQVTRVVRRTSQIKGADGAALVQWDPAAGKIDARGLEGHDAAVHLAGENIAEGRWTESKKARIRDSRVQGTRLFAEALAGLSARPRTLISASATGYYGDRGDEILREDSAPGNDFLADVCRQWEAAADAARQSGIRVVHPRFGIVLSAEGGALAKMLMPFRLGVGGRIGDGKQYMSWIALDDVIEAIHHMLATETLTGPVNTVAPNPVTNAEFTRTLGRVLERPTLFHVPVFGLRLAFGEMADAALLSSARVEPARLLATNFKFAYPTLESALRHVLGRRHSAAGGGR